MGAIAEQGGDAVDGRAGGGGAAGERGSAQRELGGVRPARRLQDYVLGVATAKIVGKPVSSCVARKRHAARQLPPGLHAAAVGGLDATATTVARQSAGQSILIRIRPEQIVAAWIRRRHVLCQHNGYTLPIFSRVLMRNTHVPVGFGAASRKASCRSSARALSTSSRTREEGPYEFPGRCSRNQRGNTTGCARRRGQGGGVGQALTAGVHRASPWRSLRHFRCSGGRGIV